MWLSLPIQIDYQLRKILTQTWLFSDLASEPKSISPTKKTVSMIILISHLYTDETEHAKAKIEYRLTVMPTTELFLVFRPTIQIIDFRILATGHIYSAPYATPLRAQLARFSILELRCEYLLITVTVPCWVFCE